MDFINTWKNPSILRLAQEGDREKDGAYIFSLRKFVLLVKQEAQEEEQGKVVCRAKRKIDDEFSFCILSVGHPSGHVQQILGHNSSRLRMKIWAGDKPIGGLCIEMTAETIGIKRQNRGNV